MRKIQSFLLISIAALVTASSNHLQAQTYDVLYNFAGPPNDGAFPNGNLVRDAEGNLYGATGGGGPGNLCPGNGCGTIFKLDPTGKETILYTFTGGVDGAELAGGVIRSPSGDLYGAAFQGGDFDGGTVYKLNTTGKFTVLHSFAGGMDGAFPFGPLVLIDDELYGTTQGGGTECFCGVIFKVSQAGQETVLYRFTGGADGFGPTSLVRDAVGNLYGATAGGGDLNCHDMPGFGCGVVFRFDTTGKLTVLYRFAGGADGSEPLGRPIWQGNGNIYGTTFLGGDLTCHAPHGCGVVYRLNAATHQEMVLHNFSSIAENGQNPSSGLLRNGEKLYGVAGGGDLNCQPPFGCGLVYELDRNSSNYAVLHRFHGGPDGAFPGGELIQNHFGNLYGSAGGGLFGWGLVFKITAAQDDGD